MEARVAVLEKIASNTEAMLTELRADVKAIRTQQESDYRALAEKISGETLRLYLAGAAAALALMALIAKGFMWL